MGNCQAIDNASLILRSQNGRAERFYAPISAAEIMKLYPGHYVALLLTTTTFYSSSSSGHHHPHPTTTNQHLRVTRIKLLRPTDDLVLGHVYRLITTQEVMKGLNEKNSRKLNNYKNFPPSESGTKSEINSNCEATVTRSNTNKLGKADKHRPRGNSKSTSSKPRGWHPSLNSISETAS